MAVDIPSVPLPGGASLPQIGIGVFQVPPDDTANVVRTALEAGCRHIDTAQMYRNEAGVGQGIRDSGLAREDVFVTTKLANDAHGHDNAITALEGSLERLGTEYVDLYLIHWPLPGRGKFLRTWEAFDELQKAGKTRAIGVSNFRPEDLDRLAEHGGPLPEVNQIELHPAFQQRELSEYHRAHGIVTEAWSPLGQGRVLGAAVLADLAGKHGRTPAQIVLAWHLRRGRVVFPKSVHAERIRENLDVADIELDEAELAAIDGLDEGRRLGPDPSTFEG
ncbi:aldo/keto reductase [Amycolatopsis benzoatilytica]|uniref:aldo/keto reductase n=1 Tax=Amycolatopsis benzoatilytica TaxID=346045 RepID=UPI00036A8081|nr:aldo/keto reductase [Amycolatopsis benzoatilytica]